MKGAIIVSFHRMFSSNIWRLGRLIKLNIRFTSICKLLAMFTRINFIHDLADFVRNSTDELAFTQIKFFEVFKLRMFIDKWVFKVLSFFIFNERFELAAFQQLEYLVSLLIRHVRDLFH